MKKSILLVAVLIALVSFCLVFASCDSGSSDSDDPAPVHVTGVKLNLTTLDIYVGESKKLEATVEPEDATNKTVSWSSNKPEFATVDAEGNVRAVAAGDAIITVTTNDGGKYATCKVNVSVDTRTFKAVYNTNGGANTLTFFYDAVDHSGEGIIIYDNLPSAATKNTDWGYNSKRQNIESVVIDASVADYKGLTSTAYMFLSMTNANSISGAENLDVSSVTDMSYMFQGFGSASLTDVPKVSGWNTGKVEDMSFMFWKYGSKNASFNAVPDVSGWDTGNVITMKQMFDSFASVSTVLNTVPDVSKWNTVKVTDMYAMFKNYGGASKSLNAVPNVSGNGNYWNTSKVEDMTSMFQDYGKKSEVLAKAPEVSNWNTVEVKKVAHLFHNYGINSPNLKTAPDVSGWNVSKVEDMDSMFENYGKESVVEFTLDLSNWDLANLLKDSGSDVFKFTPSVFNVTIPAKTGDKANDATHWYYWYTENDAKFIAPPMKKTFTVPSN